MTRTRVSRANSREQSVPRFRARRVVLALLLAACGKSPDRAARELASLDPADAALRVRAMVDGCEGFSRALDRIHAARIRGRTLDGLVDDAVTAARQKCPAPLPAVRGRGAAHQLALARLLDDKPADALAALSGTEPALRWRRAELLDRLGRPADAIAELDTALATTPDADASATRRLLAISVAARNKQHTDVVALIAAAPLPERPTLAFRAVADTPADALGALADAAASNTATLDIAVTAADRIEELRGPAGARGARERIAEVEPGVAEHWDALGRARIAAGDTGGALAAWDKAIAIAPAQPSFRVTPIRALVIAGDRARAKQRAAELAAEARTGKDPERFVTASAGASAAGDTALAAKLAREGHALRPTDGRLAFLVGERLAEASDRAGAAEWFTELLVCGAHGRPWHRHEVAGKLLGLASDAAGAKLVLAALDAPAGCAPVEPADLATYVDPLRTRVRAKLP